MVEVQDEAGNDLEIGDAYSGNEITDSNLFQGYINCNNTPGHIPPNYPKATVNQYWRVSIAGQIGGASGVNVDIGDLITCTKNNTGGSQAAVGLDFTITKAADIVGSVEELTPASRTYSPVLLTNDIMNNLNSVDTAIGSDNVAVARTNNPVVVSNSLNGKIQVLDNAIGATPTSTHIIVAADTVNQNLSLLDVAVNALQNVTSDSISAGAETPVTTSVAVVNSANGVLSIKLPPVSNTKVITIYNITAAEALVILPATGEYINAGAINIPVTLVHATDVSSCICTYASAGHWTVTAIHGTIS